jgi:hypothetical protein
MALKSRAACSPKTTEIRPTKYSNVCCVVRQSYAIRTEALFYKDPAHYELKRIWKKVIIV